MKKLNKKVLALALSVMLIMCAAVTALSYSMANPDEGADTITSEDESIYLAAGGSGSKKMIDFIIEKLNSSDADNVYNIVEVSSSDTPSALQDIVETLNTFQDGNGDDQSVYVFMDLVLNGHKSVATIADLTDNSKLIYTWYSTTGLLDPDTLDECVEAIQAADFVYVSNDPDSMYSAINDIPEDAKDAIGNFATADMKPLMIDSPTKTEIIRSGSIDTFTSLADNVFAYYGASRYTFKWPTQGGSPVDAQSYFSRTIAASQYLPIHGDTVMANWRVITETDSTDPDNIVTVDKNVASILTIKNGAADNAISALVYDGITEQYQYFDDPANPTDPATWPDYTNYMVVPTDSVLYKSAYISSEEKPDIVEVVTIDISNANDKALLDTINFNNYDMVIIEAGCKSQRLTAEAYNNLSNAMYGLVHIVYNDQVPSGSAGGGNTIISDAINYAFLIDKTTDGRDNPAYSNILVCDRKMTAGFAMATGATAVDRIADIINNGTFRNMGGSNSSSNKYTVLEIQPCYPIDTVLADKLSIYQGSLGADSLRGSKYGMKNGSSVNISGFYYMNTEKVSTNTPDEISYGNGISLSEMKTKGDYSLISAGNVNNVYDYYAWEISKAKVAHATGLGYDEVEVVHMSSNEFACSKSTLLDNFDAIYIGGNNSAIRDINVWIMNGVRNGNFYNMYYHHGDTYDYPNAYGKVKVQGNAQSSFGVQMGNDITQDKLEELSNYVAKGMPVIFSNTVSAAYTEAASKGAGQTKIDPESNMYAFIKYARSASDNGATNILWNFDPNDTIQISNVGDEYGKTFGGFVTVFGGVEKRAYNETVDRTLDPAKINERNLAMLLNTDKYKLANARPKLNVTNAPMEYKEGNANTIIDSHVLDFSYDITGSSKNYEISIYVDDDGNSRFTEDELLSSKTGSQVGTLSVELADDFFGPVYWKLEVKDPVSGASASTYNISKIKRPDDQPKDQVALLQILPDTAKNTEGSGGYNTLWFCTECQQSVKTLRGNRLAQAAGKYGYNTNIEINAGQSFDDAVDSEYWGTDWTWGSPTFGQNTLIKNYMINPGTYPMPEPEKKDTGITEKIYKYEGNSLGPHVHKFGIVKYDTQLIQKQDNMISYDMKINGKLTDAQKEQYAKQGLLGADDWTSNWADEIKDDYDFETDILTTRQFETLCANIKAEYDGLTEAQISAKKTEYQNKATEYYNYYIWMKALINKEYGNLNEIEKNMFKSKMTALGVDQTKLDSYAAAQDNLDKMLNNIIDYYTTGAGKNNQNSDFEKCRNKDTAILELKYEIANHAYYDFFSLHSTAYNTGGLQSIVGNQCDNYRKLYATWRDAMIYQEYFHKVYLNCLKYSSVTDEGELDFTNTYSTILFGAAEKFAYDDINTDLAMTAITDYIKNDGSLILFHDTITYDGTSGKNITEVLREYAGQDARHLEGNPTGWGDYLVKYSPSSVTTTAALSSAEYFLGTIAKNSSNNDLSKYMSSTALTSYKMNTNMLDTSDAGFMYKYGMTYHIGESVATYDSQFDPKAQLQSQHVMTNRASQNNEGIVTRYPFRVRKELEITPTHPQAFALDVEDPEVTVWYSLAGGSKKSISSLLTADPHDGDENYFIYTYGSVTYCGAGHTLITGKNKENNDERKLFINVICNSVRRTAIGTNIKVYDYDEEEKAHNDKEVFIDADGNYYMEVTSADLASNFYPKFAFITSTDTRKGVDVTNVKIYYDLDYSETGKNEYTNDKNHILIFNQNNPPVDLIRSGNFVNIFKNLSYIEGKVDITSGGTTVTQNNLLLKSEYFTPYNNEYTYIVIEVTDSKGKITRKRIKIKLAPMLNELT